MTPLEEATEFQRRRSLPYAQVQRMSTKRTFDVLISIGGQVIASKTEVTKRGKVVSTTYFLPALDNQPSTGI